MWGFLATSYDSITSDDNSANKPYFCLSLLANLADILRPVDARLIILGIFMIFSILIWNPTGQVGWLLSKTKKMVYLMCLEIPRKLYVQSLQRPTLPWWPELLVLVVYTLTIWSYIYYFLVRLLARELEFLWDIPQYLEWNKYPWGQYYMVHHFVSWVAQDLSNLGVLCLPSWM